jgi:hypothetical protein
MPNPLDDVKKQNIARNPLNRSRNRIEQPGAPSSETDSLQQTAQMSVTAEFPVDVETGETGGPQGPEPTRYGDWEKKGRCIDF